MNREQTIARLEAMLALERENIPLIVQWVAQDADGFWFGYEREPVFVRDEYAVESNRWDAAKHHVGIYAVINLCTDTPPADASKELYKL